MKKWIEKTFCKLGTILTFVWAASLIFANPVIIQLNSFLNINPIVNLASVIGLIVLGFYLSQKCNNKVCGVD